MRKAPDLLPFRPGRQASSEGEVHEVGVDVLTDVLDSLGVQGRLFCRSVLSAPWGMALPASDFAHFHVIERGGAWLHLDGRKQSVALSSGDLVVLPHGRGHQLADSPGRRPVPLERLLRDKRPGGCSLLQHGGGGPETVMLCGSFRIRQRRGHPLLSLLPEVVHLRGEEGATPDWLAGTLRLLAAEARSTRPGRDALVSRLTEVLFVQVLRAWMESLPGDGGGWLGALKDPRVGAALAAMHEEPGQAWTVDGLAARAGMSRSPFAARFAALVGEPPLAYLTRWRMQVAARLLQRESLSVGEAAARVGYASEPAFSRAFKRALGVAPGAWRRQVPAA